MRNEQAAKAIELWKQLESLIVMYENCDTQERAEQHIREEDLIAWIRDIAIPEFNKIDAEFKKTSQTYWVQKM